MKNKLVAFSVFLFFIPVLLFVLPPRIDKNKPTVVVILGYSFFLKEETPPGRYIEEITRTLEDIKDIRYIIVCGANTLPGESGKSEAEVLKEELWKQRVSFPILVEDVSKTTGENIKHASEMIENLKIVLPPDTQIIIFSDFWQKPKVWWYSRKYFSDFSWKISAVNLWRERSHFLSQRSQFTEGFFVLIDGHASVIIPDLVVGIVDN